MLGVFLYVCVGVFGFCVGNVMGWSEGIKRKPVPVPVPVRVPRNNLPKDYNDIKKQLVDELSRNSLVYFPDRNTWSKVYDVEVIDE